MKKKLVVFSIVGLMSIGSITYAGTVNPYNTTNNSYKFNVNKQRF